MTDPFERLRREYAGKPLSEDEAEADPIVQLEQWIDDAVAADVPMANAMSLATATADGRPSVRIVLLKGIDHRGFVFYTNYESRKARELEENGRAALCLWWEPLHRQIRIEGTVARIDPAESDAYFATRPRASNLGAMASPQSQVVSGRDELDRRIDELRDEWEGRELERPTRWGGYRVDPDVVELWQGRPDRLHDRLRYVREPGGDWRIERLAP